MQNQMLAAIAIHKANMSLKEENSNLKNELAAIELHSENVFAVFQKQFNEIE